MAAQFSLSALTIVEPEFAMEKARAGDLDGAVEMMREVVDGAYESGDMIWRGRATEVLVQLLVRRGSFGDQQMRRRPSTDWPPCRPIRLRAPRTPAVALAGAACARARRRKSYRNFLEQHRAKASAAGYDALIPNSDATMIAPQHDSATQ